MKKRVFPTIILIIYSVFVFNLLVLKTVSFRIGHLIFDFTGYTSGPANLVPFRSIMPYLLGAKGRVIALFELVGNIALFVPIGFLAAWIYRTMTWKRALILAAAAPLFIEIIQAVFRVGIFDVDDIILNGLGLMIGYSIITVIMNRS